MSANEPDPASVLAGFLIGLIAGVLLIGACQSDATDNLRNEATANNAAHWTIDPETGERAFVWGPQPKEERENGKLE